MQTFIKEHPQKRSLLVIIGICLIFLAAGIALFLHFSRARRVVNAIPLEMGYESTYRVINRYPHDAGAFTQGLLFYEGFLYESTGMNGQSSLRRVDLQSGTVLQSIDIADAYFAEGLVLWGNRLIQLTWKNQTGFVYDRQTFALLETFSYPTEGWGITHDGTHLIMSDGSDTLFFLDPATFQEVSRIQVRDGSQPVVRLNELEYVQGQIFANIWLTDEIVRIDPQTGNVLGRINLGGLLPAEEEKQADVLNGIAYDAAQDRLFITGKYWQWLFEIVLEDAN